MARACPSIRSARCSHPSNVTRGRAHPVESEDICFGSTGRGLGRHVSLATGFRPIPSQLRHDRLAQDQAVEAAGGSERSTTGSALAWFGRAMRLQDEFVGEARPAYQEAIRLRPAFVEAHVNLGLLNHNMGERKEAEACYRRALRYAPTSPRSFQLRSRA